MVLAILDAFVDAEDGAYAIDMQQRVVYWNRAAQRILGYAPSEALGKRCFQVFWGAGMDLGQECSGECFVVQRARAGKIAPSQTILARSKAGQTKWLSIVHVLLPAEASSGSALLHIFHDVTEEVEAKRLFERLSRMLGEGPLAIPAQGHADIGRLSSREREVLDLLAQGLGTRAIAESLVVSPVTARNHVQRVLAKLGVHTRLEAVAAMRHGAFAS